LQLLSRMHHVVALHWSEASVVVDVVTVVVREKLFVAVAVAIKVTTASLAQTQQLVVVGGGHSALVCIALGVERALSSLARCHSDLWLVVSDMARSTCAPDV
jgi:hypothetical protein